MRRIEIYHFRPSDVIYFCALPITDVTKANFWQNRPIGMRPTLMCSSRQNKKIEYPHDHLRTVISRLPEWICNRYYTRTRRAILVKICICVLPYETNRKHAFLTLWRHLFLCPSGYRRSKAIFWQNRPIGMRPTLMCSSRQNKKIEYPHDHLRAVTNRLPEWICNRYYARTS